MTPNQYSIASTVVALSVAPLSGCGFKELKVKILNANPLEQTLNGRITAVAKYHVNTCFNRDFSKQYNIPGVGLRCRSQDERISVSSELTDKSISSEIPVPLTFDFGSNKIPISATYLYIQVIYRGNLGSEVGTGVAIGEINISEPTAYRLENNDDYTIFIDVCHPFSGTLSPGSIGTGMSLSYSLQFNGDPTAVTGATLARGEYAAFAFLTDPKGFPMMLTSSKGDSSSLFLSGDKEQLDKDGVLSPTGLFKDRSGWKSGDNAYIWDYTEIEQS